MSYPRPASQGRHTWLVLWAITTGINLILTVVVLSLINPASENVQTVHEAWTAECWQAVLSFAAFGFLLTFLYLSHRDGDR